MKKIFLIGITSAALIATVSWLCISGHVVWVASPGLVGVKAVCGDDIIDGFNKATQYERRAGPGSVPTLDKQAIKQLAQKVKTLPGFEADPTCQEILYWTAMEAGDKAAAKDALALLKQMNTQGRYPNNNLRTAVPLFEYE